MCAGEWPGTLTTSNEIPPHLERLAAREQDVRRVRAHAELRGEARLGRLEQLALALGHVHGCAGRLGEVGDAPEVVEVPVRDQDRGAARAHAGELEPELRGIAAGVDDDRLGRAPVGPDDVAVRPERAELVRVDRERHQAGESNRALRGYSGFCFGFGGCPCRFWYER